MNIKAHSARSGINPISDATLSGRRRLVALVSRDTRLSDRFTAIYGRLQTLTRAQKRLICRAAGTLAGAALLLALSGIPTHAANISVANGAVVVDPNGICSLREAIANANDTTNGRPYTDCSAGDPAGADTITLPFGGTFMIGQTDNDLYGPTGLPAIETTLTITGNGATIQRAADEPFRLLAVAGSGDLTLQNVNLTNGFLDYDYGGAVLAYGDLTIRDCTFSGNEAYGGGAILAYGVQVTIVGSQFKDNTAVSGGGLSLQYSTTSISETTISGGEGPSGWGGGGLYLLESQVSISDSVLSGNSNAGGGGGLKAANSTLSLNDSQVADNKGSASYGGGLYLYNSQANILRTTISGNNASNGGGIYHYDGSLTIHQSLIEGNMGNMGGSILNGRGAVTVINSTITGNKAANGGGIVNQALMNLENATVTGNTATGNGGGIQNLGGTAELTLRRTLIAGNTAGGQGREVFHAGKAIAGNHFNGFGFNGNSGVFGFAPAGDSFTPAGPLAGVLNPTLGNNGGPTQTHALPAGSPAIDRSPSAECMAAPVGGVDQRGQPRNQNADDVASDKECDVGAVEATGTIAPVWRVFVPGIHRP